MFCHFTPTQIIPISPVTFQSNSILMKLNSDAIKLTQFLFFVVQFLIIYSFVLCQLNVTTRLSKKRVTQKQNLVDFCRNGQLDGIFLLLVNRFYEIDNFMTLNPVLIYVISSKVAKIIFMSKRISRRNSLLSCFYKISTLYSSVGLKDTVDSPPFYI